MKPFYSHCCHADINIKGDLDFRCIKCGNKCEPKENPEYYNTKKLLPPVYSEKSADGVVSLVMTEKV